MQTKWKQASAASLLDRSLTVSFRLQLQRVKFQTRYDSCPVTRLFLQQVQPEAPGQVERGRGAAAQLLLPAARLVGQHLPVHTRRSHAWEKVDHQGTCGDRRAPSILGFASSIQDMK